MIIFRPHRGSLAEAMSEAKEFDSEADLKQYVVEYWCRGMPDYISLEDVVIYGEPINDDRIGWKDTRYVCCKRFGNQDNMKLYGVPQCVGMCATQYKK